MEMIIERIQYCWDRVLYYSNVFLGYIYNNDVIRTPTIMSEHTVNTEEFIDTINKISG